MLNEESPLLHCLHRCTIGFLFGSKETKYSMANHNNITIEVVF